MENRLRIGRRGGACPGENPLEGSGLGPPSGLPQRLLQTRESRLADGLGRGVLPSNPTSGGRAPEICKQSAIAWQRGMPVLLHLAAKEGTLLHQIAPVTHPEPQLSILRIERRLHQSEAHGGRGEDADQIGVVRLDARVGRLTEGLAGQRMDDAAFQPRGLESPFDGLMIGSCLFDCHNHVFQVMPGHGLTDLKDGHVEVPLLMRQFLRRFQDRAVEVGEHPLGTSLGTVDTDDAEAFRPNTLDSRLEHALRLVNGLGATRRTTLRSDYGSHTGPPPWGIEGRNPIPLRIVQ